MRFNWTEYEIDRGIKRYSVLLHGLVLGTFLYADNAHEDETVNQKKAQVEKSLTEWVETVTKDYNSEPRPENHPDLFPADHVSGETPGSGIDKPPG